MKNLKEDYYNLAFSHIYVEKAVSDHARTKTILSRFPTAAVIEIDHYKDIFCRRGQNYGRQHRAQKLILAEKKGNLIYRGAPVCQNFGNEHFYYTSCIMNCIFDCEYCYLKGMYPSANIVIFVNLEDFFEEAQRLLKRRPLYLCVSYDTDLNALEPIAGYAGAWCDFASGKDNLKIEVRTKSANQKFFCEREPSDNVIFAFTLSPAAFADAYEHYVPPLSERIACVKKAVQRGFLVRLCFDPVIYLPGWQRDYQEILNEVFAAVDPAEILDVSVGSFRIAKDYLKNMRRQMPDSAVVWFPYQTDDGYCHYPDSLMRQMEQYLYFELEQWIGKEKIFLWNEVQKQQL